MLELSRISKRYGAIHALESVDLAVAGGETVVLVGPSGCGKSTLLRLVVGLLRPDAGSVAFEGEVLDAASLRAARQRMGYVIQEGGLFPHLTVRGNVSVMARHLQRDPLWIERRLSELAELTRLPAHLMERYPAELSGGQRQRVSLMRALMLDPDLLLLDEPLGALDPMIRYQLQQELKVIFDELGKTVVMVTHDVAEAAHFSQRLVLMRDGQIAQSGSLRTLAENPADSFVKAFVMAQLEPVSRLHAVLR